ncbi:MAG: VWA domain-containing protein [Clostridia bacterium]|nr:VWA domain-containing protein [Clostridia bacterium]
MKKLNIKLLLLTFLLITLISTISLASYSDVTMSVISEPVATIKFGEKSYIERRVISKDLDKKEITFQLKVVNEEVAMKPTGEIMLVLDNSKSMLTPAIGDRTRESLIIESAKTLITNLLKDNEQLKIGAVSFSAIAPNADGTAGNEGTINDAKVISQLTNNKDDLISSISNIPFEGDRTNLQAGVNLAKTCFTPANPDDTENKVNKYVIILTDGVPNISFDFDNYFSDSVIEKTKNELSSLSGVADKVITMLTGIVDGNAKPMGTKTNDEIIEEVFGTTANPTIGKFYYVTDDKVEQTITTDIYNDLVSISKTYKDIEVVDTFSKEIVDNFTFSIVKDPNFGTISDKIDLNTNSITWNIPELKSTETAIVQYKIKLKENYSTDILDKILDTHTKLDITYTDSSTNIPESKSSDITPQIKLVEPEKLPTILPKAGKTILYGGIVVVAVISVVLGIRYIKIKNDMK